MRIVKLLVCLAAIWLAPDLSAQQITGSIRGTVTDPSGGVVEGASVTARQTETGLTRTTTTDHVGAYLLLELQWATTNFRWHAADFKRTARKASHWT
jgi:Carboxypeptidase regulatory-like domain